jgi:hypothetical protein|tara:strand:- start:811 stop:1041 length:231 start_codon:yes stop_codon:yes gene_type:complete
MSADSVSVGTIIMDNGSLGIITNEIKSGTWSEEPWFNWTTSYEIKYFDGTCCIMTKNSLKRLMESGKIVVLDDSKK